MLRVWNGKNSCHSQKNNNRNSFSNIGLSKDFLKELDEMETSVKYKAQDLVFALLKIKKYRPKNYEQLYDDLIKGKLFDKIKSLVI